MLGKLGALVTGFILGTFFGTTVGRWLWDRFVEFVTERWGGVLQ